MVQSVSNFNINMVNKYGSTAVVNEQPLSVRKKPARGERKKLGRWKRNNPGEEERKTLVEVRGCSLE